MLYLGAETETVIIGYRGNRFSKLYRNAGLNENENGYQKKYENKIDRKIRKRKTV